MPANPWEDAGGRVGGLSAFVQQATDKGLLPVALQASAISENAQERDTRDALVLLSRCNEAHKRAVMAVSERRLREHDAKFSDIGHSDRIGAYNETLRNLLQHIRGVIQHRDRILARLQEPASGQHVTIEADSQESFLRLIQAANEFVANVSRLSDAVSRAREVTVDDAEVQRTLEHISLEYANAQQLAEAIAASSDAFMRIAA